MASSRELFDKYGGLSEKAAKEDGLIAFRSLLEGGLLFCDEATVNYRVHDRNVSQNLSVKKRIDLQRKDTLMKLGWIEDYFASGVQSEALFSALVRSYRASESYARFLSIPVLGSAFTKARKTGSTIKRFLKR